MSQAPRYGPNGDPRRNPQPVPVPQPTVPQMPQQSKPSFPSSGNYFDDPLLQGYVNFGNDAIKKLSGPQEINPVLQQAIDALTKMSGGSHVDTSFLTEFGNTVHKRQAELNQPGYTQSQQDLLRTNVSDPLTAQRDARRQQIMEHMSARGIAPGSGIMEQALQDAEREYGQTRATGERELATGLMAQDENRKNQAVDIGQVLAQLGLSTQGLEMQGRGQGIQASGALAGIGQQLQDDPIRNLLSAYGISAQLGQLPFQANQNAIQSMNAVNNTNVPQDSSAGLIQLILALSGRGEDAFGSAMGDESAFWGQFGSSMPALIDAFSKMYGNKGGGGVPTSNSGDD
jgi:hypothetical protein